jgi:hypothetical protein
MEWKLVISYLNLRYGKYIVIIGSSVIIIILIILYNYISKEYKTYDNNVFIITDKVINDYDLGNDYYIYYNDINTKLHGKDIVINMSFSICETIENAFEIIVPYKYRSLVNKTVNIMINNSNYSFLVIGVSDDVFDNNFIYTNSETMQIIYNENFKVDNYTYRFIVDNYASFNSSLDILNSYDYDFSIGINRVFAYLTNYDSLLDLIIVFIIFFIFVILIFLI